MSTKDLRATAIFAAVHYGTSMLMLVLVVAGAYGSSRGWENSPTPTALAVIEDVLTAPLLLARLLLPQGIQPGYGPLWLLVNTLIWTVGYLGVRRFLRNRHRPTASAGT